MNRDEMIAAMAELVAGLQVPVSLMPTILGAAYAPWEALKREVSSFGWVDKDEVEAKLREVLG